MKKLCLLLFLSLVASTVLAATVNSKISTASTNNVSTYTSASFAPAAGDLLIAFVDAPGTTAGSGVATMTDSQGLGFSLAGTASKETGADTLYVFVAMQPAHAGPMTVTFDCTGDAATGAVISIASVSGVSRFGPAALRQIAVASNRVAGTVPTVTFGKSIDPGNATLGFVANASMPAGIGSPLDWVELDGTAGFLTPTAGAELVSRDRGFAGTVVTWDSSSTTAYGVIAVEVDTSAFQSYQWPDCDAAHPCVIQHVQTSIPTEAVNGIKVNLPNPALANNTIVCGITHDASNAVSSIVDDHQNVWSLDKTIAGSDVSSDLWRAGGITAGTKEITFNLAGNTDPNFGVQISCSEIFGLAGSSALDGSSGSNATVDAIKPGTITTTQANDLVYNYAMCNYGYPGTEPMLGSITADNGSALVGADLIFGIATQLSVTSSAGAVSPTLYVSQTNRRKWNSVAAAYRFDGTGTLPSAGIRIVHVYHVYSQKGPAATAEFPSTGNLIVLSTTNNTLNYLVNGVGDNNGNTYTQVTQPAAYFPQIFYAANAISSQNLKLRWTQANSSTHFVLYDISGAAQNPFDVSVGNSGTQLGANADITGAPVITPTTPNGLIISLLEFGTGPPSGAITPGMVFDSIWAIGQTDTSGFDTGDGWSHTYNSGAGPISFDWHVTNKGISTSWDTLAVAFKAAVQPVADFTLSLSPALQTVTTGDSATYAVSLTASDGFNGSVALSVDGLPAGAIADFSVNPTNGNTTLTVHTGSAATGSYPLTITGTNAALTHTVGATLKIDPAPDFAFATTPATRSVSTGGSTTFAITETPIGSFNGEVTLSVLGLPAEASASFSPNPTKGASTLTIDTGAAPTGNYALTITGANGTLSHESTATLSITEPQDFSLGATPGSQTVVQGGSASYTITETPSGIFSGQVSMSIAGVPAGATASFTPNPTSSDSTLVVNSGTAASGAYTLTITGTSGDLIHSTTVALNITPAPDFGIAAAPPSQSVVQGGSTGYAVGLSSVGGFSGNVTLSISGLPAGASGSFSQNPTTDSSTLTVDTGTAAAGSYTLQISALSGALSHSITVALNITSPPDFALSATPSSRSVVAGGSTTYTLTSTPSNGFAGAVSLNVTGLPAGASAGFTPNPTTGSSTLSVNTGSAVTGSYTLTITGTSGAITHSTTVSLTVTTGPDFTLAVTTSRSVGSGGSTTFSLSATKLNGFVGTIPLNVIGLPSGATASFSRNPMSTSSTMTVATGTAAIGSYALTIIGTNGTLVHSVTVTLNITKPDFSLGITPSSRSVAGGSNTTYSLSATRLNGFTGSIALSVDGLPAGATASFSSNPMSTSSTLTVRTATAAIGTYTLTITGTSGALTHSATVTLNVTTPPGFSISATPTGRTVNRGSSGGYSISIARVGGFTSRVSFSVTGVPSQVSTSWSSSSTTGNSTTVTLKVGSRTVPGTYNLTVTGTNNSLKSSVPMTLTVQ